VVNLHIDDDVDIASVPKIDVVTKQKPRSVKRPLAYEVADYDDDGTNSNEDEATDKERKYQD
jgi:hypothetical protein